MFVFVSTMMAASQQLQWEEEEADHAGKSSLYPGRYCYSSFIAAVKDTSKAANIIRYPLSASFLVIIKVELVRVATITTVTTITMVK
jgi:hypothetical protein